MKKLLSVLLVLMMLLTLAPMALAAIPQDKQPAACLHCGSCEQVCPQQIHISDVMEDFVKVLGE